MNATKNTVKTAPKLSQIKAAVKVLARIKGGLNCQEMVEKMESKKLWTSPNGQTPHCTLYAAILREINTKGKKARFKKVEAGRFALRANAS